MTQNKEIITYLKRFSDTTFPVAKQRELALFQRNLEAMFGTTTDLMRLGATFNGTPPLGNLLFWEVAGEQHCGVAVLKNGFRVYSITQQKGLAEIPQGARTFDVRVLLTEEGVKIPKTYTPDDFNFTHNRCVVRVRSHTRLYKQDLRTVVIDNTNKPLTLLPHTKIVKLQLHEENPTYRRVLVWYSGAYYDGYIDDFATTEDSILSGSCDATVFINDVENIIDRAQKRYDVYKNDPAFDDLKEIINQVRTLWSSTLANKSTLLTESALNALKTAIDNINVYVTETIENEVVKRIDEVPTINNVFKAIFGNYNSNPIVPIYPKESTMDETIILPLSERWFKSDVTLKDYYLMTSHFKDNVGVGKNSGEGFSLSTDPNSHIAFDPVIKSITDNANDSQGRILNLSGVLSSTLISKEWLFLQNIQGKLNTCKTIVIIGGGIWGFTDEKVNAEGIGLEISFGNIKMPFLLTILIHEKVVNTSKLWLHKDTHISMGVEYRGDNSPEDDTNVVKSWVQSCNTPNCENLPLGIIDHLYQSHSCIAVLELLYLLNVLNNKI
jgi:hypothetical protein